ncbi:hypothetical protein ACF1G5_28780 [Streptomyces coeruleorubidus]|uniref:hypothetical protein n=1 Tax=Streptomyces coeruleorubidus TaxID=116188 RepID=UPI00370166D4
MIQQVPHTVPGADPAGVAPALAVASELHAPAPATRAPEVAVAEARPARKAATRRAAAARRRTVRG